MPSTYSTSLKLQLIGTGEQAGTWGTTTNTNLGTLLEEAITGVITIPMGDATYTLTNFNGLSDEARNAVLILNGPITSPQRLVAPPGQEKVYIVRNRTGNTVTLTTGSGSNVNIANAASEVVFTDGANFYSATQFNYIDGNLTVTGNASIGNSLVVLREATFGANIYANASTGQVFLPTGNTSSRAATGTNGLIRYNSELQIYEGYQNNVWIKFITANQNNYTVNYLVVAGGAGGGNGVISGASSNGGGGGAGGMYSGAFTVTTGASYTITVGAGGARQTNGVNSSLSGVYTSIGGGAGGTNGAGGSGGSGGGGGAFNAAGGGATTDQGNAGGAGGGTTGGGGGGGKGAVGATGTAGAGGIGAISTISGTSVYYAGGGGGADQYTAGAGGQGGGGSSGTFNSAGNNGVASTGGGGGGGGPFDGLGGAGGSGIVFLSIPTASYTGTTTGTPTVTVVGSNTVLQYTNSGTYTG